MYKKIAITITISILILSIFSYIILIDNTNSAPIYKTPLTLLNTISDYEIGECEYLIGNITSFTFNNGSGKAVFNNTLTIGIPMGVNNSGYIMRGEGQTFKTRVIRAELCCNMDWELNEIIEVLP